MLNFIRKRMNKKGFTLVELLVVIAVLGIIAGIAIPRMSGVTDGFKARADVETARNLARQVQIRIQLGAIDVPNADETVVVSTTDADATDSFGEVFNEEPQSNESGFFVIEVTEDDINVYIGSAVNTVPADEDPIHTIEHGGVIE